MKKKLLLFLLTASVSSSYGMIVLVEDLLAVVVKAGLTIAQKEVNEQLQTTVLDQALKDGTVAAKQTIDVASSFASAAALFVTPTGNDVRYYVLNMTNKAYKVKLKLHCLKDNTKVTVNAGEAVLANTAKEQICLVEEVTIYDASDKDYKNPLSPGTIKYNMMDLNNMGGSIIQIIPGPEKDTIAVAAYINQNGELKGVNPKE